MTQMIGTPAPNSMISSSGMQAPQAVASNPQLQGLMDALMKQRMQAKLAGRLPGTVPPPTTAQSAAEGPATLPNPQLSLGGTPPAQ